MIYSQALLCIQVLHLSHVLVDHKTATRKSEIVNETR